MKKSLLAISGLILTIAMTGCVGTLAKSKIKGSIGGQPFEILTAKNAKMQGIAVESVNMGAFSNRTTIKIQSVEYEMDPAVITTSGTAQAAVIRAAVESGVAAGKEAAAADATGGACLITK